MLNKKVVLVTSIIALALCGCNNKQEIYESEGKVIEKETEPEVVEEVVEESFFNENDYIETYDKKKCVYITLDKKTAVSSKETVTINNGTIKIKKEGTYVFTGTLEEGKIIVDAGKKDNINIVLKDADITSKISAPIYVKNAKKVVITLDKKSKNKLSNGGEFKKIDSSDINGVIYSEDNLTINGEGKLNIETTAGHGVVSKKDLKIINGNIDVKALNHGLKGTETVRIGGGKIKLDVKKDGIYTSNKKGEKDRYVYIENADIVIKAINNGVHASGNLIVNSGKIDIKKSYNGLEGNCVDIIRGDINIVSSDDGINAAGGNDQSGLKGPLSLVEKDEQKDSKAKKIDNFTKGDGSYINISGGKINIDSEGDGLDSNGSVLVNGGEIYINGATKNGNGVVDYAVDGQINGGIFVATCLEEMEKDSIQSYSQGIIVLDIQGSKNETIKLMNNKNKSILKWIAKKKFKTLVISCPDIVEDNEYTIKVGNKKQKIKKENIIYSSELGANGDISNSGEDNNRVGPR